MSSLEAEFEHILKSLDVFEPAAILLLVSKKNGTQNSGPLHSPFPKFKHRVPLRWAFFLSRAAPQYRDLELLMPEALHQQAAWWELLQSASKFRLEDLRWESETLGPFGTLWDPLGPFGTLWDPLGPFGTLWDVDIFICFLSIFYERMTIC